MNLDALRADLAGLADRVAVVDLRDRSIVTSRRRRTRRATLLAVVVVLLVAAAVLVVRPLRPEPATPVPTPLPTYTGQGPQYQQPALTTGSLSNAVLNLPPFAGAPMCGGGSATFRNGTYFPSSQSINTQVTIVGTAAVVIGGEQAVAAAFGCVDANRHWYQVAAFQPTAGGAVRTVGQVVAEAPVIFAVTSPGPDQVAVEVGDVYLPAVFADTEKAARRLIRTYGWNGTAFAPSGAPAAFAVDPPRIHLSVAARGDLVVERGVGRLSVVVRNSGRIAAPRVELTVAAPNGFTAAGSGWTGCSFAVVAKTTVYFCSLQLGPGEERELRLEFVVAGPPPTGAVVCNINIGQQRPYVLEEDPASWSFLSVPVVWRG